MMFLKAEMLQDSMIFVLIFLNRDKKIAGQWNTPLKNFQNQLTDLYFKICFIYFYC